MQDVPLLHITFYKNVQISCGYQQVNDFVFLLYLSSYCVYILKVDEWCL